MKDESLKSPIFIPKHYLPLRKKRSLYYKRWDQSKSRIWQNEFGNAWIETASIIILRIVGDHFAQLDFFKSSIFDEVMRLKGEEDTHGGEGFRRALISRSETLCLGGETRGLTLGTQARIEYCHVEFYGIAQVTTATVKSVASKHIG